MLPHKQRLTNSVLSSATTLARWCLTRQRKLSLAVVLGLVFGAPYSVAKDQDEPDWWFDVELIAFKRVGNASQIEEDFREAQYQANQDTPIDLMTLALIKQAQPLSRMQANWPDCEQPELEQINTNIACIEHAKLAQEQSKKLLTSMDLIAAVPKRIEVDALVTADTAHLLDTNNFRLLDYAKKVFAQRDISPLLHVAWRQPVVFEEENADYYLIYAGNQIELPKKTKSYEDLAEQFEREDSQVLEGNDDRFFEELQQALDTNSPVVWEAAHASDAAHSELTATSLNNSTESKSASKQWELNGKFKTYLKYINRVPYLHIESEFMMHEIALDAKGDASILEIPFKQRRRIISKQIHYFDHPKMGIIVSLQRYEKPPEADVSQLNSLDMNEER